MDIWQVKYVRIGDLIPNAKNPRKISKEKLERLQDKIQRLGFHNPVKTDENLNVLGGNQRLKALLKIAGKDLEIPVMYPTRPLTQAEKDEIVITDNISDGEWDWEILTAEWDKALTTSWGLDWGEVETAEEEDNQITEDEVPEEIETRCKRGDIWQLGKHRLMCGDSTKIDDVEKLMNGEKADLLFTDPPYGVSYEKKTKEVLKSKSYTKIQNDDLTLDQFQDFLYDVFTNAFSCLKDTASYYVFSCQGGDQEMMMMMMMRKAGIPCRHQIIWVKDAPVFSMGRLDYDYKHEPILYGWVKNHDFQRKGEQDKSVWEYKRTASKLHPTMKPVELIANALLNSTKNEENVLDVFGGSGSTLIACEQLNRNCFMMELDEHYCDVIIQRWENLTGEKAVLINN